MRTRSMLSVAVALGVLLSALSITALPALGSGTGTRLISSSGTSSPVALAQGSDAVQNPEIRDSEGEGDANAATGPVVNRSQSNGSSHGASVNSGKKAKSNPDLKLSFDGLNHRDQRLANGGNQFSIEPPDQGLCVGNGFVVESTNDVFRVFNTAGNAVTGVVDLNTFYGYAPAINRTTGAYGPFVTDPSCYYDEPTERWFHVVLTLDVDPDTGDFLGPNHIDLAVSQSSDPTGAWTLYKLPVQDDGTEGTPDHGCSMDSGTGPCIGDYPHIGADKYGFYVTTNEYSLFGPEYKSAQIYAFSKSALASNAANVAVTQFDTTGLVAGDPGFTIWPAITPGTQYAAAQGGTEYFMSSTAAEEANGDGSDTRIVVWALTNTKSLNSATPAVSLTSSIVTVNEYGVPPASDQKPGDIPLGECLNIPACATNIILGVPDPFTEELSHLDSNDSRMQQVTYANGKLWGALDTAVTVGGENRAGIAWYILNPSVSGGSVSATVARQGYLAMEGNNLTYPAIAVAKSGRGVMAFTVVGEDHYPSAGYAGIDASIGAGDIHIAAEGLGPSDGFTSYKAFVGDPPRTRWGDYGAAVADGSSIWIASEYIGQTCTLTQYLTGAIGSCGGTRTALANWATRISKVTP